MNKRKAFARVFNFFNNIIPKNDHYIYMMQYMPYKDNIAALLDELKKNKCYQRYIITLHDFNLKEYEDNRVTCVKPYSIKSMWRYFRSKYIFCDNGVYGSIFNKNQKFVFLTHGMTVKKFGYYLPDYFKERSEWKFLPRAAASYAIATGPAFIKVNAKALGISPIQVLETGLPRNDYLFVKGKSKLFARLNPDNLRSIIWMPTYRRSVVASMGSNGADYELGIPFVNLKNIDEFNEFLEKQNVLLVIKRHTMQNAYESRIHQFSHIKFVDSDDIISTGKPLYDFVKDFDALITDYSSILYDFLLLNRPICNVIDDIDEYQKNRGLVFEKPEDKMATLAYCYEDMRKFILAVSTGNNPDSDKRRHLNKIFNTYIDNNNAYRVLRAVGIEVDRK